MNKKIMFIVCAALTAMPVLGVAAEQQGAKSSASACDYFNEKVRFKCQQALFNNDTNKAIRSQKLAEKEAADMKKKVDAAQDKGEGSFKVKF